MSNRSNESDTYKAVADEFAFWLSQHPVTMEKIIEDAAQKAISEWLTANQEKIVDAIKAEALL